MGMLALEMGDRVTARSALMAVVTLPLPLKVHLGALGSLAIVAAGHDDEKPILDWAISEVVRLRNSVAPRFGFAQALLECAIALRAAGRIEEAKSFRDEASGLARLHGFNELLYRADEMEEIGRLADRVRGGAKADVDTPAFSTGRSGEIVSSVRELEPAQLPRHVMAAPALT